MEARQTLRGTGVPKVIVIVLAACMAIALAIGASVLAKDFTSSSSAVTSTVHPAAGTVLRQDNPPKAAAPLLDRGAERQSGAPAAHTGRSTGSTSIQDDSPSLAPGWSVKSLRDNPGR